MPISTPMGIKVLDGIFRGIYFEWPESIDVRLWTVAPNPDGSGGTEVTGGNVRPLLYSAAPTAGSAGRVAQVKSAQPVTFSSIDQASDMVEAISFHDHESGEIVWLAAWSPADPWAAGDSPTISPGNITQAFTA